MNYAVLSQRLAHRQGMASHFGIRCFGKPLDGLSEFRQITLRIDFDKLRERFEPQQVWQLQR